MPAFKPCVHGKRLFGARAPSGARRNHISRPHKASYTDKLFRGICTGALPSCDFLPFALSRESLWTNGEIAFRVRKASYTDKFFRGIRSGASPVERITGIEPASSAWEADVLPMNYIRIDFFAAGTSMIGKNRASACIEARFLMQQALLG